jgi:hypothetical protein
MVDNAQQLVGVANTICGCTAGCVVQNWVACVCVLPSITVYRAVVVLAAELEQWDCTSLTEPVTLTESA